MNSAFDTRPPPFDAPVDLEAHLDALPPHASLKGMFIQELVREVRTSAPDVDLFAKAGVAPRRLLPFTDYPYSDYMRLVYASAPYRHPGLPRGEALRRIGRSAYSVLLRAQVGRVLFAAFGSDFGRVAAVGARGWKVSVNFGEVEFVSIEPNHGAFRFRDFPAFLETLQVGVVEGAMELCGVRGRVWSKLERSIGDGVLEFWWT